MNFSRVQFFKKGFPAILCVDQNVNISLTDLFIPNMTETVVNSKKNNSYEISEENVLNANY